MARLDPLSLFLICLKGLIVSALVWSVSAYRAHGLHSPISTSQDLFQEPLQTLTEKKPFEVQKAGQAYQIKPVNEYELWGLVVSVHDSAGWDDYDHAQWKDFLNTKDICVIWGKNLENPFMNSLNFSHGQWTCYVQTSNNKAWENFKLDQLSNNHLIPSGPAVAAAILDARIGDEIHFKGQLVNYGINHGPPRVTSTTREDTGPGACEIVYVDQFEIAARHNVLWVRPVATNGIKFCAPTGRLHLTAASANESMQAF